MQQKLHIYEEATNLFWGLVILVATTLATYILANSFVTDGWSVSSLNQIIALLLFALSFVGILKISEPLYHFTFSVKDRYLVIKTEKGEQHVGTEEMLLSDIEGLRFSPYTPRSSGEALFDFSTNYQLMLKKKSDSGYRQLITPDTNVFTLKVEDISKIIKFIKSYQPSVSVPAEQADFFGL